MLGTLLIVFVVLNLIFVRPLFSDWRKFQDRGQKARDTLAKYEQAIAQTATYEPQVRKMEGEGMSVPPEDLTFKFMTTIQSQAAASGVTIQTSRSAPERTNAYFIERVQAVGFTSKEEQLVDFLYNLGAGDSLIRVRSLSLRPDQPHFNLTANLTLVASYQKKIPVRAATPAPANPPAAAAKPTPTATDKQKSPTNEKPKSAPTKSAAPGVPKPSTPTKK